MNVVACTSHLWRSKLVLTHCAPPYYPDFSSFLPAAFPGLGVKVSGTDLILVTKRSGPEPDWPAELDTGDVGGFYSILKAMIVSIHKYFWEVWGSKNTTPNTFLLLCPSCEQVKKWVKTERCMESKIASMFLVKLIWRKRLCLQSPRIRQSYRLQTTESQHTSLFLSRAYLTYVLHLWNLRPMEKGRNWLGMLVSLLKPHHFSVLLSEKSE